MDGNDIAYLRERLEGVIDASTVDDWLSTPNPGFDGLTPQEIIESGETGQIDRIWAMIYRMESGEPG